MEEARIISISRWIIRSYLHELQRSKSGHRGVGSIDGDQTNILYKSKRSPFEYVYLRTLFTLLLDRIVMLYLYFKTGIRFNGSLNTKCSPVNMYTEPGSCILLHRDRNMTNNQPIDYIATIMLKPPVSGGRFIVGVGAEVENNGKTITKGPEGTFSYWLYAGDCIILDNRNTVHGTGPLIEGTRISLTFRSK